MALTPSPPQPAVSGACFLLPAVCFSDSGSESKSGRLWSHCCESCTSGGWGGERCREQPGLLGCTELDTPLRGSGSSGGNLGEEKLLKGCYIQIGLVENCWGNTMVSALVSPCQHLLFVRDGNGQQRWSTWGRGGAARDSLFPKHFGHPLPRGDTSPVGLWHPDWASLPLGCSFLCRAGTFWLQYK